MSTPHKDNPVLGVFFALIAALMLASMNMFGKLMGEFHSPIEITFYRNLVAFIILLIGLFAFRKINLIKTKRPKAQLVRSAIGTISMVFSMWVVVIMPLTTATAFLFTSPLFVTLLSYPLLKEKIGIIKFLATLLGFSGILLIAQPDTGISIFEIFIGLLAGLLNGLVAISLRWLGNTENTLTTNFYFLLLGLVGTSFIIPFIGNVPNDETLPLIFFIGSVGLLSLLFKTQGFRLGSASLISPISYTIIIWTILYDYFLWKHTPSFYVLCGASIIILSNIFIIYYEKIKK